MPESDAVGSASIAVHRGDWASLAPDLAVLVAPPVTVTAAPLGRPAGPWRKAQLARSRGNMPVTRHRRSAG